MTRPRVTIGARRPSTVWAWWIAISVLGAAAGAVAAWQIRALGVSSNSTTTQEALRYLATITSAVFAAGGQWWVLQRYRVDAYWWAPATVAAGLFNAIAVIPAVLHMFDSGSGPANLATVIVAGASALAASGLVVGAAQAFVLRSTGVRSPWLWVPATMLGGALSGSITTALSSNLLTLGPIAVIILAATGALLGAACQAPILSRMLRPTG